MFFKYLIFFCFLLPVPSYGFLENAVCLKQIKDYSKQLFEGTLHWEKQERLFTCVHDTLELLINNTTHDQARDYYTEEEMFKFFHFILKHEEVEAKNLATKILAIKKMTLGGHPHQFSDKELQQTLNLVYDFEKFFYIISKDIPVFRKLFIKEEREFVSPSRLDRALRKLGNAFNILSKGFQREEVVHDFSDLDQYHRHLDHSGFITERAEKEAWKSFSDFLQQWAGGLFSSAGKIIVEGEKWEYFFPSFHQLFSQFAYYKMYLVGKDIFEPETIPFTLKSLGFFVSSLEFVKYNSEQKGFPLKNLDKMLQIIVSQVGDDSDINTSPSLSFLKEQKGIPLSLLTRSLVCFSLDPVPNPHCSLEWSRDKTSSETVRFHFPDGQFLIHEDRQTWIPNENIFYLKASHFQTVKNWMKHWELDIHKVVSNKVRQVAQRRGFSHWLKSFFGQMEDGRFQFGHSNQSTEKQVYTLIRYEAFIRLLMSPYFDSKSLNKMSKEKWTQWINELSPALIVSTSLGYKKEWRNQFINLFDYADLLFNSSNNNQFLEKNEVLDIIMHLMSAKRSSELAFQTLSSSCKENSSSCISKNLFSQNSALNNFQALQNAISPRDTEYYAKITQSILPDVVTSPYELMDFFMLVQMMETNFYLYDKNQSNRLESKEFFSFTKKLESQLVIKIPYLFNEIQARAFLMYSAKKEVIPFLTESEYQFSSIEFTNWYLYPEKWKNISLDRKKMLSLALRFYQVQTTLGSQSPF